MGPAVFEFAEEDGADVSHAAAASGPELRGEAKAGRAAPFFRSVRTEIDDALHQFSARNTLRA
jgi:hypothetical protein